MKRLFGVTIIFLALLNVPLWGLKSTDLTRHQNDPNYICHFKPRLAKAYFMGLAADKKQFYVLAQMKGKVADRLQLFSRKDGSYTGSWELDKHYVFAVTADDKYVWIASRRKSRFLRQYDKKGNLLKRYALRRRPRKMYGLTKIGKTFYFVGGAKKADTIFSYTLGDDDYQVVSKTKENFSTLSGADNKLYLYSKTFASYSSHWLLTFDLEKKQVVKKQQFLNKDARALTIIEGHHYFLFYHYKKIAISSFSIYDNIIIGRPRRKKVVYKYRFYDKQDQPFQGKFWVPVPLQRRFQLVDSMVITPTPDRIDKDKYGNHWAYYQRKLLKSPGLTVQVCFNTFQVFGAFTIDKSALKSSAALRKIIPAMYFQPTYNFDYKSNRVQALIDKLPTQPFGLTQLINLRNLMNDRLEVVGPSGPPKQASVFLRMGTGRCYAHTISFAAAARALGYPVRAIGGWLPNKDPNKDSRYHTWNQLFIPKLGWVDIDTVMDDAKNKKHRYRWIGQHNARYHIVFEGNYDAIDYKTSFTSRSWMVARRFKRVNRKIRLHPKTSNKIWYE